MSDKERDAQVDQLLHDAEHAESGARFARSIGHSGPATNMTLKAFELRARAAALDPRKLAPAWAEDTELAKRLARRERGK